MRTDTKEITPKHEMWRPISYLGRSSNSYTISYSPLLFRTIMSLAIVQINLLASWLRGEAAKSEDNEDMFAQFQEIQKSVGLAFIDCFRDFVAQLEQTGNKVVNEDSLDLPTVNEPFDEDGYTSESEEESFDPNQRLLIVLSNIAYCKVDLFYELYNELKFIWQSEQGEEEDTELLDLVAYISGVEEKRLEKYTLAKVHAMKL